MILFFIGLLSIFIKSRRFVYLLLSLEIIIMGVLIFNITIIREVNFILILVFSVSSSVVGLIILVNLLSQFGSEYVKF